MSSISPFVAFGAGILSFFSPCVLPLIPAYISFVTGLSLDKLREPDGTTTKNLKKVFWETVLFVAGFSLVFVALGASVTFLGNFLLAKRGIIKIIGGLIIIVLGLHIIGLLKIKYLQYEKRMHLKTKPATLLGSFIVGVVFALGWTPCIGPILGGILTMAATEEHIHQGVLLLSCYSLGLGIPFILTSLFIGGFLSFFTKIKKHFGLISIISGGLLIAVGLWILIGGIKLL